MTCKLLFFIVVLQYWYHVNSFSQFGRRIMYSDNEIIVAEKPHNMLSVPGVKSLPSFAAEIAQQFNIDRVDQCIVHRLDYATSGIMVFARNILALRNLHEQFRQRSPKKKYVAIVTGKLDSNEGKVTLPIGRDKEKGGPYFKIDEEHGKASETLWRLLAYSQERNSSLIELIPITGRTHQLRLHMAAIAHPIIGDEFYFPSSVEAPMERLLLHAAYLRFHHPQTQEMLEFSSSVPFNL